MLKYMGVAPPDRVLRNLGGASTSDIWDRPWILLNNKPYVLPNRFLTPFLYMAIPNLIRPQHVALKKAITVWREYQGSRIDIHYWIGYLNETYYWIYEHEHSRRSTEGRIRTSG